MKKLREILDGIRQDALDSGMRIGSGWFDVNLDAAEDQIKELVRGIVPEPKEGDGTGFAFTEQLTWNDCRTEILKKLEEL